MAAAIGKYAANKYLKKQMKGYANKNVVSDYDPYFAMIPDPKKPGKLKKVKKQIPSYISEHDANVLASVRKMAYRLDMSLFNLFGIRFGWEAIIGLVPFAGDAVGVAMAYLLFQKASKVEGGLSSTIRTRMLINIVLDFVVGLIPFVGDIADAAFKCNTKNCRLLEEYLDKKYKPESLKFDERTATGMSKQERAQNRKSGIYLPHDPPPATAWDDSDDEEIVHGAAPATHVQQPAPTRAADPQTARSGWFSGGKKASGQPASQTQPSVPLSQGR